MPFDLSIAFLGPTCLVLGGGVPQDNPITHPKTALWRPRWPHKPSQDRQDAPAPRTAQESPRRPKTGHTNDRPGRPQNGRACMLCYAVLCEARLGRDIAARKAWRFMLAPTCRVEGCKGPCNGSQKSTSFWMRVDALIAFVRLDAS